MKVIVQDRQCLVDIALQTCGSLEAVFALAERNNLSITDDLSIGQVLEYDISDVQNRQVVNRYNSEVVIPSTSITTAEINDKLGMGEGIGFWAIEYDFVVS
ncbi:MAG: hypothetical protein ACI4BD_05950 [Paludibacteraceae bacterium]